MTLRKLELLSASLKRKKDFAFISALKKRHPQTEVFLVGGIIRDTLLGRASKDFDYVVRNVSLKALQQFLTKHGTVNLVGRTFGVLKFSPRSSALGEPIDIALPRSDHAFNTGGYKDVTVRMDPTMPIEKDLARRDFTVNAMAWDMVHARLIDPCGGIDDLKKKRIRTVGNPVLRFREDATRILRGIRFACQLGYTIDQATLRAMRKMVKQLGAKRKRQYIVPRELVGQECIKMFLANPVRALDELDAIGAVNVLIPELLAMKRCPQPRNFHMEGDVWKHTHMTLEKLASKNYQRQFGKEQLSAEVIFASLFHDMGKPFTIQTPEKDKTDRIRFNNHDVVGAEIAKAVLTRLAFSVFPKTDALRHIDPDRVAWIIQYHLVGFRNDIDAMRETTVEKYFLNPLRPSESLIRVQYADTAATIHENGKADFTSFRKVMKRIARIKKSSKGRHVAPERLIDGNDVMRILNIPPGKAVGEYLDRIREAQLSGKIHTHQEALAFLKKRSAL